MSFNAQKLFELLPAIYHVRDAEQGGPLQALLAVIADQTAVLEEDLSQLYDDQFIETCADWVVPYIGDLIGYHSLHPVTARLGRPRAEVAHTIGYRRRKGTAAMLEQLARDVTGWDARAVEFFQLLATTQFMNHVRPTNWYAPDLRSWERLERLDTAFDTLAHTVDVRRVATGEGKYNIRNVGLFLWRLAAQRLSNSPAFRLDDQRYLFSPLGNNAPLFTRPETEESISHLAEPMNVPEPISRRVLNQFLVRYYGEGKSIFLKDVPPGQIIVCNLADASGTTWAHTPPAGKVAIDPVLGRIAFAAAQTAPPLVTFHRGFSADLGGGEYEREASLDLLLRPVIEVAPGGTVQPALDASKTGGVVQLSDSGRYAQTLSIEVNAGQRLELRAANEHRPIVVLSGNLEIRGGKDSEVTLNGLVISGGMLRVSASAGNELRRLRLRHCTLVPGWSLSITGESKHSDQPSLIVNLPGMTVEIDHCIVGALQVVDSANVRITDSIVDATSATGVAYVAPGGGDFPPAGGPLRIEESTIIGKLRTKVLELASNTIFLARLGPTDPWPAPVLAEQRQAGCVRFSYVPPEARVPRRFRCQPDLEIASRIDAAAKQAASKSKTLSQTERDAIRGEVLPWLVPAFMATRYGEPAYGQLRLSCPTQIRQGADDEAEMGAFHDLFQPQREINLRVRLEEYLRFGLEAGIFYAT